MYWSFDLNFNICYYILLFLFSFQSFFCGEKKNADRFNLPNHSILSESGEVTDFVLSQQVKLTKFVSFYLLRKKKRQHLDRSSFRSYVKVFANLLKLFVYF